MLMADVTSQGCDGCNAFVTDVIVTYFSVVDVNHIFRDKSVFIVTDGKSHIWLMLLP